MNKTRSLTKLNKANKDYNVKILGCGCYVCACHGFAQIGVTHSVFQSNKA